MARQQLVLVAAALIAAASAIVVHTSAQVATPSPVTLSLEAVSVKPTPPDVVGPQFRPYGSGASVRGITPQLMLQMAYGVQGFQIAGGPAWVQNDRFDVVATLRDTGSTQNPRHLPDIIRAVLEDRFSVKTHREQRDAPILKLEQQSTGSKLVATSTIRPPTISAATGYLAGTFSMATLSDLLSWRLERVVVDETGLSGVYDIELIWLPDTSEAAGARLPAPPPPPPPPPLPAVGATPVSTPTLLPIRAVPPPSANAPSIYTALQEQLGLKLTNGRGLMETLVVDQISRPAVD